jgi:membrane associated rhomboid family serine protease
MQTYRSSFLNRFRRRFVSIYFVLAGFGCLAGVTTVLFGFGGGFVVVPLLYRALLARTAPTAPWASRPCTSPSRPRPA